MSRGTDAQSPEDFGVLEVISTRGIGYPGWYIFKRLEDHPDALGIVDGPFATPELALRERRAMYDRRQALARSAR